MNYAGSLARALALAASIAACSKPSPAPPVTTSAATSAAVGDPPPSCVMVDDGDGPRGATPVRAETLVSGLEVPWGIAFLPGGDWLITERPGRVRLVHDGALVAEPVARVPIAPIEESGLLGIAPHPDFAATRAFFLYATVQKGGRPVNRVERWTLTPDHRHAALDRVIVDDIPSSPRHDGGRLRVGPDGMLWIGTGDATEPDASQSLDTMAGKILRVTLDGAPAPDDPWRGNRAWLRGARNVEAFDWLDPQTLLVADHGPSGELGRRGHDEIDVARAGVNLGWPAIYGCEAREGMITPILTWSKAEPPGGAAIYRGRAIPAWSGSLLVGMLGSKHLHRVVIDRGSLRVTAHETYFEGDPPRGLGRVREVITAPDGEAWVTTSNCDGRGQCPPEKDRVVRIAPR